MPDVTISAGDTEEIISERAAGLIQDDEAPEESAILYVSGDDVRIVKGDDEQYAREGLKIVAPAYVTEFRPRGNAIVAYGDGTAQSTVHVHLVTANDFTVGEIDG